MADGARESEDTIIKRKVMEVDFDYLGDRNVVSQGT